MSTLRERIVNLTVGLGERTLPPLERWLGRSSLVGDQPFYENDTFLWPAGSRQLADDPRRARRGARPTSERLPNFQDISTDQATITDDDRWKTYFFYGYGFRARPTARAARRRRG